MADFKFDIKMNVEKYGLTFIDRLAQLAAAEGRNQAKKFVANPDNKSAHPYSEGHLRNNIMMDRLDFARYEVYVDMSVIPYAAAQEWGRPDLPAYTFTPYMRPAAIAASQNKKIAEYIKQAEIAAERIAKVSK